MENKIKGVNSLIKQLADKDTLSWLRRLGITEATGDDKFDSMMGKITTGGASPVSNIDTLDTDKKVARIDNFVNREQGYKNEPYRKSSNEQLIVAGDKIVKFIINFCNNVLGPTPQDRADNIPPEFFYCERMLKTSEEFEEMIEDFEINPRLIPADVEKYASEDFVDWICKKAGVSRKDFEYVEDLAYNYADGASTDVMRMFPYAWFYDMVSDVVVIPWEAAKDELR